MPKEKQKRTVADKGKKKLTTAGEEKENSRPVDQVLRKRNTGIVIRDEQDIRRLREDERKAEAKATEKQKGTIVDKGKKKITTAGKKKENSCPVDQVLRKRNTGIVIRDEQDIRHLREDERKAEAKAMEKQKGTIVDKGKKKITTAGKKKENSCPVSSQPWLVDAYEKLILRIMQRPNRNTVLTLIMVVGLAIYMCVPIKENYLGVVLQGGDQDSFSFSTSDATNSTYTSFIEALRARLTNGVPEVSGIPMLPQSSLVPDKRRFVLVDLSNYDGNTVTVAIDVVDVYVVAFRVRDRAYFFQDAPEAVFTTLFTETVNPRRLNCTGNYGKLEGRSQSRGLTDLGITALDQAISNLWYDVDAALGSSFLVIIQMVSEAVRFRLIERRVRQSITKENSFRPDPRMLSLENKWSSLSTEIQSSHDGVEFNRPVRLQRPNYNPVEVANSLSPVIADLALLLYRCPARPQSDDANLALRITRTAFSIVGDDDECDNDSNLIDLLVTISFWFDVLLSGI
ncbi:nigrin b-like isoform X2 [Rhododendron vialii]|uniref:nigrin b-like isoform X2 n=1 Tax=Rhododendron vialii TaxID=182163 RepID=UPI00265EC379|nr:nigrin b-like isoform X2 [Rhododendron vialii]